VEPHAEATWRARTGFYRGKRQIVYGLLCAANGCPVAIEVFEGNTADPMTLTSQVTKLKERFALDHVVLVGDRGMITQARISEDLAIVCRNRALAVERTRKREELLAATERELARIPPR
jgi:transposase